MEYWLNLNVTVFIGPDSLVAEINSSFKILRAFFFSNIGSLGQNQSWNRIT